MERPRIAVVVASLGRAKQIAELHRELLRQSYQPHVVVYSVTDECDLPDKREIDGATVVYGSKGLPRQRNRGMEAVLSDSDIVVFFDDDYLPSRQALAGIASLFCECPDVVGANGHLLADGINNAGIDYEEAMRLLEAYDRQPTPALRVRGTDVGLYGCHMAFRVAAIDGVRFDEALPLYGWQEDIDFAHQMMRHGSVVFSNAFAGVHRGVKTGRTNGVRLGYSQIANPIYLGRKGTMPWPYAMKLIGRNLAANHGRLLRPEPWVDRWGRVRGNWLALFDLLARRMSPGRILDL